MDYITSQSAVCARGGPESERTPPGSTYAEKDAKFRNPFHFSIFFFAPSQQISLMVALCQWSLISCDPGIISQSQEFRKAREKQTASNSPNSIADIIKSTTPAHTSLLEPIKITHEDVVLGNNAGFGSQQQQQQLSNGGIIFAIRQGEQGSTSTPLVSTGLLIVA
jgi:hypothetical protein